MKSNVSNANGDTSTSGTVNTGENTGTARANIAKIVDGANINIADYIGKTWVPFHLARLTGFVVKLKSEQGKASVVCPLSIKLITERFYILKCVIPVLEMCVYYFKHHTSEIAKDSQLLLVRKNILCFANC